MPKRQIILTLILSISISTADVSAGDYDADFAERRNLRERTQLRGGKLNDFQHGDSDRSLLAAQLDCVSNEWHLDFTKMSGNWCSNSRGYPDSLKSEPSMIQPSAEACCAHFFQGKSCQVNKVCSTEETNDASSPMESKPKPTARPSSRPSSKPTNTMVQYYSIPSSGLCSIKDNKTPAWITDFYTSWKECCNVGWVYEQCMKEAPPGALIEEGEDTTTTTTAAPKVFYYEIPTTGMCEPVDKKTPSWMKESDFFLSYTACCKKSWNADLCLLSRPDGLPTFQPTHKVTLKPTAKPSREPTPEPTIQLDPTISPSRHPVTDKPSSASPTQSPLSIDQYKSSCEAAALWHPTADYSACTNSPDYDSSWNGPALSGTYLHEALGGCCESFFKAWGKECVFIDICTASPTKSPVTDSPSKQPTAMPVPPPTASPSTAAPSSQPTTAAPSNHPTNSPTATPIKYYLVFSTGMCTPLDAFTPYWMTEADFYLDYRDCCESSWNKDPCLAVAPTRKPTTMSPSSRPSKNPTANPTSASPSNRPTTANPSTAPSKPPSTSPTFGPSVHPTSASPTTLQPTTKKPTGSPTRECASGLWHPSDDFSKCTNSFWYDKSWDNDPSLKATYLQPTAKDCCALFFEAWNRDCVIENICDFASPPPSARPTPKPVTPQPVTPQPVQVQSTTTTSTTALYTANSSCKSALWHPTESYSACTNDFNYKVKWNYPPLKDTYLHESVDDCCAAFFDAWGKECVVVDICASSAPNAKPQVQSTTATSTTTSSSCKSALWHPTEGFTACSNDFDYKGEWNYPPLKDTYLHESVDDCCALFFDAWGKECVVVDICSPSAPSARPTPKPVTPQHVTMQSQVQSTTTTSTTVLTANNSCNSALWHPTESYSACTNDFDYKDEWDYTPMKDTYLHESLNNCCKTFFHAWGKECVVVDICGNSQVAATLPAEKATMVTVTATTTVPSSHNPSGIPTHKPSNGSIACEARPFHPGDGLMACTNSLNYPESQTDTNEQYLSAEECCQRYIFPLGRSCRVADECAGTAFMLDPPHQAPSTTSSPTTLPTKGPVTLAPMVPSTSSPTSMPLTNKPTGFQSSSPTASKWYSDRNPKYEEGRCINTIPIPKSAYTYDSKSKCCSMSYSGQRSGVCLSTESTTTISTSSVEKDTSTTSTSSASEDETSTTSTTTTIVQYYLNSSNGMCAPVDKNTPSWTSTFYTDWEKCCKSGWVFDKCMAAAPKEAGSSTSTTTTSAPVMLYSHPSSGMCAPVSRSTPSWISTFYTNYEDCCKAGWAYDRCIAKGTA